MRPLGVTLDFERPWKRFVLGFTGLVNDMMLKIGVRPALNVPPVNHRQGEDGHPCSRAWWELQCRESQWIYRDPYL